MKKGWGWSGVLSLLLVVAAVIPEQSGAFYEKTCIILKNNTKYKLYFKCWRNQEYLWMGYIKTIEPGKKETVAFSFINIIYYVHGDYWCDYWRPDMKRMCRFKAYDYQKDYYHCRGPREWVAYGIDSGRGVFDTMSIRDLVCWNTMITGYEQAARQSP